jgi:NAD(P)H-hydrate epimerase
LSLETTIMKLLNKKQIRDWDNYTIRSKDISSFELMKQASVAFSHWFQTLFFDFSREVIILCGPGNNGGDGLCVSKILEENGYQVTTYLFLIGSKQSTDNKLAESLCEKVIIQDKGDLPSLPSEAIIIDALLGSGISGKLREPYSSMVSHLNTLPNTIVSIDISSGLDTDGRQEGIAVQADFVLSFEIPKRAFFYKENQKYIGSWSYRGIGLLNEYLLEAKSPYHYLDRKWIKNKVRKRASESSKIQFGFGQLCGGSEGMYGAVILAARAAMRCGLGRLAVSLPKKYEAHFIAAVPEAMTNAKDTGKALVAFRKANRNINVVAAGPALGMNEDSIAFMDSLLMEQHQNLVLDADALNIISRQKWQSRIPKNTILTPHEGEFERLFGSCEDHYSRVQLQIQKSKELKILIVLKGKHTSITSPEGDCYFNATGNVGMATGGSGDVLTGMIMSFLAQGYSPLDACCLGVYTHGASGDQARLKYGEVSLIASDIIEFIPESIKNIYGS